MISDMLLSVVKMHAALSGKRCSEKDIRMRQGRIARAYKHADKLGDPAPVVTRLAKP